MFIPQEERATVAVAEPPRVRRRIFINPIPKLHVDYETDGMPGPYYEEDTDTALVAITGGYMIDDVTVCHPGLSTPQIFELSVWVHERHGWTLESLTATEALLWKAA